MSACSSCGAPMIWARTTASGKSIPLDPDPVADGNIVIESRDPRGAPLVRVLSKDEQPEGLRYKSHFATCPHPERHRR